MRSYLSILLFAHVCILLLIQCNKDEFGARPFVRLITHEVTDITDSGATFVGELVEGMAKPITEIGFIYSTDSLNSISKGNKIILPRSPDKNSFSAHIDKALLKNQEYYVRAYLLSDHLTILGNNVKFYSKGSKPPLIKSFFPLEAKCGDTLKISGSNFSPFANENTVKFNSTVLDVIAYSDSSISAMVRSSELTGTLTVSVQNNIAQAPGTLKLIHPSIDLISPASAWVGDTVLFSVRNLNVQIPVEVKLGLVKGVVVNRTTDGFQCIVSDSLIKGDDQVIVSTPCNEIIYHSNFQILAPQIHSAPSGVTGPEEDIVLLGKGFFQGQTQGYINGYPCRLVSVNPGKMVLKIPLEFLNGMTKKAIQSRFELRFFSTVLDINQSFLIDYISNWTLKQDFPGEPRKGGIAFSSKGKGYFGLGEGYQGKYFNDIWEYDPAEDSWKMITFFPGESRAGAVCFILQDIAYIGLGRKELIPGLSDSTVFFRDFFSLNMDTRSWKQLSSFPGKGRESSVGIGLNDHAYILGGENIENNTYTTLKDQYKYSIINDHWSQLPDFINVSRSSGITLNNKGFFIFNNKLFALENDQWSNLLDIPFHSTFIHAAVLNNNIYFGFGLYFEREENFFEINFIENKIKPLSLTQEKYIENASIITLLDKGYIICGNDIRGDLKQQVWEFDPTKPR